MTIDASAFNFDAMKEALGGKDPFAQESNKYGRDERFYTLSKDKNGNGAAIIRFLPDSEKGMIQKLFSINTTITKNGKKRFVSEYTPSTIGLPCPFQEKWQELWNSGDKEGSKLYSRGTRFVTNIKVIKDPANPENEGKIFLYALSGKMKDKIQAAIDPSEQDRSLGATPKELFNPLRGNSFKLACSKGSNNQVNYDKSEVISDVTSIYNSVEEALEDIKTNTYKLSDLIKPEAFLSYEELQSKLKWVQFQDTDPVQPAQTSEPLTAEVAQVEPKVSEVQPAQEPEPQVTKEEPKKADDLDSLLEGLI